MENYKTRTAEDICLLCRRNDEGHVAYSNATNSHFTPMGIIRSNTGRRNYETTISINLTTGEDHEVYYGRSNLENSNPEVGNDPHMADYIFCQECEDRLAEVENEMISVLNVNLRNPRQSQNFPSTAISENEHYRDCTRVDSLRFKMFIYSIIWRQNLQQQLVYGGQGILSTCSESALREAVSSGLYEGTESNQMLYDCFPFTIVTAEAFDNARMHSIMPHPLKNYPEVFSVNEYIVLLYDQCENDNENDLINQNFCGLSQGVFEKEYANHEDDLIKIVFIPDDVFQNFQELTHRESGMKWMDAVASEEFSFALRREVPNFEVEPSDLFLDTHITQEQKNLGFIVLSQIPNWNIVKNRRMTQYKLGTMNIRNRQGFPVPVYFALLEIRNIDENLYCRLGFYGSVD